MSKSVQPNKGTHNVRLLQSGPTIGFQLIKSALLNEPNCNATRSHVSPTVVLYQAVQESGVPPATVDGLAVTVGIGGDEESMLATQ